MIKVIDARILGDSEFVKQALASAQESLEEKYELISAKGLKA